MTSPRQIAQQYGVSRTLVRNRLKAGWKPGEPLNLERKFRKRPTVIASPVTVNEALRRWPVVRG